MRGLFRISGAVRRDPTVEGWFRGGMRLDRAIDGLFSEPADALRAMARTWFDHMRDCGADVRELMHDGCPVACVEDAPFGYVNAFKAHVSVGFFHGAALDDPAHLLQGGGKHMRHVKLGLAQPADAAALRTLISAAYRDIRVRLASSREG